MQSARERFYALKQPSRKKKIFSDLRVLIIVIVATALAVVYSGTSLNLPDLLGTALSKSNRGVVLNYLNWAPEDVIQSLGEPIAAQTLREDEQLLYWNFDPVRMEIHFFHGQASRIAFATRKPEILGHLEGRILEVFGREEDWEQQVRNIDGTTMLVYENRPDHMTLVTYDEAVMVYNYLFPEAGIQ